MSSKIFSNLFSYSVVCRSWFTVDPSRFLKTCKEEEKDKTFPFQHEQAVCDNRGTGDNG